MFARGQRDEGLQRLCHVSTTLPSNVTGGLPRDQHALQNQIVGTPSIEARAYMDRIAKVNNVACYLYQEKLVEDSLRQLQELVRTTIQVVIPSSVDDAVHRVHATILRNIAYIYFVKECHVQALSYSKLAIECNRSQIDEFSAALWFNLGFLAWQVEESAEQAEFALNRSLGILTKLRAEHKPPEGTLVDRDIVSVQALLLLIRERLEGRANTTSGAMLRMLMARRTSLGYEHESVSNTLCALGSLFFKKRKFDTAANFFREAYRLQQKLNLPEEIKFGTLTQLGQCFQPLGQNAEAMSCFREALRLKGKTIMHERPQVQAVFATALYNIGMIQSCQGDRNDQQRRMRALHSFKLCLDLRRKALGSHSPGVASALHNIGILLLEDGQVSKSMQCFEESIQIRREALGPRHHEVASSLRHIGKINQDRGEYDESLRRYLEALWILRQSSGDASEHLIEVLMGLGQAQHMNGLLDKALRSYEEASNIIRKRLGKGNCNASKQLIRVLNIMGGLALDMVDSDTANKFYIEAAQLSGREPAIVKCIPPCAAAA